MKNCTFLITLFMLLNCSPISVFAQVTMDGIGDLTLRAENNLPDIFFQGAGGSALTQICIDSNGDMDLGNTLKVRKTDGRVQVGTSFSNAALEIHGFVDMTSSLGERKFQLYSANNGATSYGMGVTAGRFRFHIGNPQASYSFYSSPDQTDEIFTIEGNGNHGFNDPNPTHTLSVNGDVIKPGSGSWLVSSDRKLKKNIKKFSGGLEIINQIQPRQFQYNGKLKFATQNTYIGVVAQELQEVAPFMVSEYEKLGETYLAVDPGAFDYLLINAVQEIKQEKDAEIKALQEQVEQLAIQLTALQMASTTQINIPTTESSNNLSESIFIKNHPNPFTESTTIDYEIPNHSSNANIHITKLDGELVQTFPIQGSKGSVTLTNQLLSAGMYIYSIEIAGRVVASEKMLLTK